MNRPDSDGSTALAPPQHATVGALIRWPQLRERLAGVSRMTVWRWERDGKFPKRLAIGGFIAWDANEVEEALVSIRDQARHPKPKAEV